MQTNQQISSGNKKTCISISVNAELADTSAIKRIMQQGAQLSPTNYHLLAFLRRWSVAAYMAGQLNTVGHAILHPTDRSNFKVLIGVVPLFSFAMRGELGRRSAKKTGAQVFSKSLMQRSTHLCEATTHLCEATTHLRRPRPLIVIAGANSPRAVTATLHSLPFHAWERSMDCT